jgi:hypothetical protein
MAATTSPSVRARRAAGLAEKTVLGVIAGAATAIGVLELVFLVMRVVRLAADARLTLPDVVLAHPLRLKPAADALVSGSSGTATLVVDGAPSSVRGALIAADALGALLAVGICAAVVWLCLRVFVGRPFVRSAEGAIGAVAILVILAGVGGPLLRAVAHGEAARSLHLDQVAPFVLELDPAPIGWGFALIVLVAAFELGRRLQRDTEGLV